MEHSGILKLPRYKLIAMLIVVVILTTESARACMCKTPPFDEMKRRAAVIFVGEVVTAGKFAEFKVARVYKGRVGTTVTVDTLTDTSCGYDFEVGHQYLVYTIDANSRLETGMCMRNDPLEQAEDLRLLGRGYRPRRGATSYNGSKQSVSLTLTRPN